MTLQLLQEVEAYMAHLPKSYFGQSKFLFTMEKQRLRRLGVPFLSWIRIVG